MEEFTTQDLIAELQAYTCVKDRKPGGVTINEWAKAGNITQSYARNILNKLMDEGKMTREKARVDGHVKFVYYKTTPEALS